MNKRHKGRKLSRTKDQRRALLRGLAEALILRERITTTEARAKELRPFIERMVTKVRGGALLTRRLAARNFTKHATKKLVDEIAPRYKERPGGYTRIIKRQPRKGDGVRRAVIEFVK